MILSIENSRIIRIGLLNEKVDILRNRLIPHFENSKTGKLSRKPSFLSSYTEEENESPDLSQSDKSSDSSNESASFK